MQKNTKSIILLIIILLLTLLSSFFNLFEGSIIKIIVVCFCVFLLILFFILEKNKILITEARQPTKSDLSSASIRFRFLDFKAEIYRLLYIKWKMVCKFFSNFSSLYTVV